MADGGCWECYGVVWGSYVRVRQKVSVRDRWWSGVELGQQYHGRVELATERLAARMGTASVYYLLCSAARRKENPSGIRH